MEFPDKYSSFLPEYTLFQFCPDIHFLDENDIEKWSSEHLFRAASKKFLRTGKSTFFSRGGEFFFLFSPQNLKNRPKTVRFFSEGIYCCFWPKKTKSQEINKKTKKNAIFLCNRINNWLLQLIKYYLSIDHPYFIYYQLEFILGFKISEIYFYM